MSFTLIIGPMFSGKSTELIRRCKRYISVGLRVLICNSKKDTRTKKNSVRTHDGDVVEALSVDEMCGEWLTRVSNDYDVIAFDEGQFYKNLPMIVKRLKREKHVIVSGLSGDYNCEPWETISKLIPLADDIIHTKALCVNCYIDAPFTKKITSDGKKIDIGDTDKYIAVCNKCYIK